MRDGPHHKATTSPPSQVYMASADDIRGIARNEWVMWARENKLRCVGERIWLWDARTLAAECCAAPSAPQACVPRLTACELSPHPAGILWGTGITTSMAYQWSRPIPTQLKVIHSRIYAQALTIGALLGAAAIELYGAAQQQFFPQAVPEAAPRSWERLRRPSAQPVVI